jgi:hypothetical protein
MQVSVIAHVPPKDSCAIPFKSNPSSDVPLMIHVRENDLAPVSQALADG